ncbi:hypothetical protein H6F93_00475 [Leptolyngbya sp. FACHB-671]|uniref:hypothetical protein n=1 Tax=Leptolyngbya sp. FACHB-671 TaxID=2692812 RepID=UPI00168606BE|nr:hypothetical protein [Leptolyngbya sp. FACHB-671]MBD2066027.1 hypothetical protein [Leptolyngbya sp. FACHB-671]
MHSIIFLLIVVPVTLAFILGFMANLLRTLAELADEVPKKATSLASTSGELSNPGSSGEAIEKARA